MDSLNPKLLKKLADTCRKAGIKSFKGFGYEFTLTEDAPKAPKEVKQAYLPPTSEVPTDTLTEEQLLLWSVGGVEEPQTKES